MSAPKPLHVREPYCVHSYNRRERGYTQPASACIECSQGPELAAHIAAWTAWLAENPDSPEAHYVAEWEARHE